MTTDVLSPRQRLVLEYLAAHGGSTAPSVARGCGFPTTKAALALQGLYSRRLVARQGTLMGLPTAHTYHLEQAGVDLLRGKRL